MILVECNPDKVLGYPRRQVKHSNDKGRICKLLEDSENTIGLVDEDPKAAQPPYLLKLKVVSETHKVRVLRDEKLGNRIVVICPQLEHWIIEAASLSEVKMADFGLSDRPSTLHREINSRLPKYKELLAELLKLQNDRLVYLRKCLER